MPKYSPLRLSVDGYAYCVEELSRIIAVLDSLDSVRSIIADLLKRSEVVMLIRRLRIAALVLHGNSYKDICRALGVGRSTVQGVISSLSRGGSGYRVALKKWATVREELASEVREARAAEDPYSLAGLKRRFPQLRVPDYLFERLPNSIERAVAGKKRERSVKAEIRKAIRKTAKS